jgi:peptidoglycan/xylan/chitin deacetylase (PgdA/CDA1 family)
MLPATCPILSASIAAGAALCAGLTYATVAPTSGFWGPVVWKGAAAAPPRYALTFDDGPTPGSTDRVLDLLGELGAIGTFFVIGRNVAEHPELLKRIGDEGHVVANHSFDHSHFGLFGRDRYWHAQIAQTDELIERIIGRRPAMFRPPMGIKTWHVSRAARRNGHTLVAWSRSARDGLRTTTPRIIDRLVGRTRAGDILLLHDGIEPHFRRDPAPTIAAIRPLVQGLRARGLEPAALGDLIGLQPYARLLSDPPHKPARQ